jgi:hypothetical protein
MHNKVDKTYQGVIFSTPKKILICFGKNVFDLPYIIFNALLPIYMRKICQYALYLKPCISRLDASIGEHVMILCYEWPRHVIPYKDYPY